MKISKGDTYNRLTALENEIKWSDKILFKCSCGKEKRIRASRVRAGDTKSCGCLGSRPVYKIKCGDVFTDLTAKENEYRTNLKILFECNCGNLKKISPASVKSGKSKRCGKCKSKVNKGDIFGRWEVLSDVVDNKVKCICTCGTSKDVYIYSLLNKVSESCGCLSRENAAKRQTTHGYSKTLEYRVWASIKDRCFNPSCKEYPSYGGRGVTMCKEWAESFLKFKEFMGDRPKGRYSIDRIDVNGNYEPTNVRWATDEMQANNKRNTILISDSEEVLPFNLMCDKYGLNREAMRQRYYKSKDVDLIFKTVTPYQTLTDEEVKNLQTKTFKRVKNDST